MPTAANLNLYRGWRSSVGWHREDEPLFGEYGEAEVVVSVSFGSSAVFKWRRQSSPDDVQYQDEFLHRTGPCREQERINVTFRWIKQHVSSCPLFKAGVACCLSTCAQGSSVPVMVNVASGVFRAFWLLLGVLCVWKVLALLVSLLCTRLGLQRCASYRTCPSGKGRWGHSSV